MPGRSGMLSTQLPCSASAEFTFIAAGFISTSLETLIQSGINSRLH
jgi:hypothetical protein